MARRSKPAASTRSVAKRRQKDGLSNAENERPVSCDYLPTCHTQRVDEATDEDQFNGYEVDTQSNRFATPWRSLAAELGQDLVEMALRSAVFLAVFAVSVGGLAYLYSVVRGKYFSHDDFFILGSQRWTLVKWLTVVTSFASITHYLWRKYLVRNRTPDRLEAIVLRTLAPICDWPRSALSCMLIILATVILWTPTPVRDRFRLVVFDAVVTLPTVLIAKATEPGASCRLVQKENPSAPTGSHDSARGVWQDSDCTAAAQGREECPATIAGLEPQEKQVFCADTAELQVPKSPPLSSVPAERLEWHGSRSSGFAPPDRECARLQGIPQVAQEPRTPSSEHASPAVQGVEESESVPRHDVNVAHELDALTLDVRWSPRRDGTGPSADIALPAADRPPPTPTNLEGVPRRFIIQAALGEKASKEEAVQESERCRNRCSELETGCEQKLLQVEQEKRELERDHTVLQASYSRVAEELFLSKGQISVMARVRDIPADNVEPLADLTVPEGQANTIIAKDKRTSVRRTPPVERLAYDFNYVFDRSASNRAVSEKVEPMVKAALHGHDVCIIMDGHSGTGKSHSMFEGRDAIAPSAATLIFQWVHEKAAEGCERRVDCSAVEVYMEKLRDLLAKDPKGKSPMQRPSPGVTFAANNEAGLVSLLRQAYNGRTVRATQKNKVSSRGHFISTITMTQFDRLTEGTVESRLVLVDLAGNECNPMSIPDKVYQEESRNINLGRTNFTTVVRCLGHGQPPFRSSKLTHLLQEYFKGDSRILLLAHISPLLKDLPGTLDTLKYASEIPFVNESILDLLYV